MKKREDDSVLSAWCESALTYVKGKRLRRELYNELYGHMEDRLSDLTAAGIGKKEAQTMTVRAMGDFNETGRELAGIYKPVWWRVQLVAKIVLIIFALMFAAVLLAFALNGGFQRPVENEIWSAAQSIVYPDCKANLDGYTLGIARVTKGPAGTVYFTLDVRRPLPWSKKASLDHGFYVEDSRGNVYKMPLDGDWDRNRSLHISYAWSGPLTDHYEGTVTGIEDASWFELKYSDYGRELRLRVEPGGDRNDGV